MKLDIGGDETIPASVGALWVALNDPQVLTRCIPGCKTMTEIAPDTYKVEMQLRVAAVGGSFEGRDRAVRQGAAEAATSRCRARAPSVTATARRGSRSSPTARTASKLIYKGTGEIGGLVAGVGQRILASVSKHLIGRFFMALRKEFESADQRVRP